MKRWNMKFIGIHGESDTITVEYEKGERYTTFYFYTHYSETDADVLLFKKSFRNNDVKVADTLFATQGPIGLYLKEIFHDKSV